jgi:hypothetical protein
MDPLSSLTGVTKFKDPPEAEDVRNAMGRTARLAEEVDLAAMLPRDELSSTRYCLAHPGAEYLVYQPASGGFTVKLEAGAYDVEWFDPRTDRPPGSAALTADPGDRPFLPPFEGPALLHLKASAPGRGR